MLPDYIKHILGGEEEDRTPDLRIANAALSQLSYPPTKPQFYITAQSISNRTSFGQGNRMNPIQDRGVERDRCRK